MFDAMKKEEEEAFHLFQPMPGWLKESSDKHGYQLSS